MSRSYEDLSRRGLIKLNKDFDQENDAILLQYLAEHDDEYEGIRFTEKIISKVDDVASSVKDSKNIVKKIVLKESNKFLDAVINAISGSADIAENGIDTIKEILK